MHIRPSDVVLEIGSGNNPNPRADILCDRYITDNGERAGEFGIVIDRPMVVADGYHLPFGDKSFDYVICSHILEHMDDPREFLVEVTRVGKRGYIEVPSALSERVFGWDFHHWYCTLEKNSLVLRYKTEGEQFGGFFHRLITRTIWFRRFFENHVSEMYVKFEWNNRVNIQIEKRGSSEVWVNALDAHAWELIKKAKPDIVLDFLFYVSWMLRRAVRKFRKTSRMLGWKLNSLIKKDNILRKFIQILQCPYCHTGLKLYGNNSMQCNRCSRIYPIARGIIPVLLSKKQIEEGY